MANYTSTHTGAVIDASVTIISGSGVTQSDLTKLNAVTSSAVELNLLDGVTASTAELNILDGATLSVTELNYLDGADSSITTLSLPDNTTITTFGASLVDDADAATARTTLGVDVAGTDNSTDVTLVTTSHDYLSLSGQAITLGQIDISDDTNLVGGDGLALTGDALSVNVDDSSIEINSDTLRVKASGVTNAMLAGSIANAKLSNSSVSYGGVSVSLGSSDATPAFDLSDATSLPIVAGTTGTLSVARGGTGATTASGARTNLNVDVAGTDNSTDVTLVTTSHDYLSLSGQAVTLGTIDIGDDTNLAGGTGITLTGDTLSTTDSEIVHDNLSGFVANEHIDHSTVSISAGTGLSGGGDLTSTRTLSTNDSEIVHDNLSGFVSNEHIDHSSVSITAGTGLSGGGDITSTRTLTTDDSAIVHDDLSGFVANEHIDHSGVSITAGAGLTGGGDITSTRDIAVGAGTGVTVNADDIAIGQDVGTSADVTFNSVTADIIGDIRGATKFQAKADVALNIGDAVYISGISGNTPTVDIADSNDAAKMPSFGLAASSVSINASVEIITFGTLAGLNTSAFSVGDILYISTNGTSGNTLTATVPTGESSLIQNIGIVQRSHASAGSIKVGGAGRTNATPNLDDGDIFIGNGSNQAVSASLNTKIEDYLDGGTSTANFDTISVDGVEITATPAELNKMDGVTSTTAELNYTDGVTSNIQTQLDLKAPLASPAFTGTATGANLTLSGDLTVNGSTTTLDTTNLAVEDNLMELNAGVTSNANDSGFLIERGSTGDNAIFMWDESADKFTLGTTTATGTTTGDITLSSTGTLVANVEGNVTGAVTGNADTATTLATARNFSLTGDVTAGAVSFDGSGNVALSTTIAANSVALGTDTTGNYMSDLTEGTGIDITHTPAEGSNATITLDLTEVGFGGGANRLITDDGDGTVTTESNLTFDGSTLTVNGDIRINDSASGGLEVGTSQDLQIYHNGSHSYIDQTGTGNLYIRNTTDDKQIVIQTDDGSGGVTDYMKFNGNENLIRTFKNFRLHDSVQLQVGTGADMDILHDGSNATIRNATGNLSIEQQTDDGDLILQSDDGSGGVTPYLTLDGSETNIDIAVDTYFAARAMFTGGLLQVTHSTNGYINNTSGFLAIRQQASDADIYLEVNDGGSTINAIQIDASNVGRVILPNDNQKLTIGADYDLNFYNNGSVSYISNNNTYFTIDQNAAAGMQLRNLSSDQDITFSVNDGGSQITALQIDSSNVGSLVLPNDNQNFYMGASNDFRIIHNGTDTYLNNYTGDYIIGNFADDKDISFRTDDGSGGQTEYLRLDGSAGYMVASKQIRSNDNVALTAGIDGDLNLVHDGTDSYVENWSGDLYIRNNNNDKDIILQSDDGSGGVTPYLTLDGSTTDLLLSPPGNVGIGTTSPASKLHIVEAGLANHIRLSNTETDATTKYGAYLGSHYTNSEEPLTGMLITSGSASATGSLVTIGGGISGANAANIIRFYTAATNTTLVGTERMRIDNSGNVGIGVTSPSAYLHTEGASNGTESYAKFSTGSAAGDQILTIKSSSSRNHMALQVNTGAGATDDLALNPDGGNVGIGTASPQANLEIDSNTNGNTTPLILENTGLANSGNLSVGIPSSNGSYASGATLNDIVFRNETTGGSIIIGAKDDVQIGAGGSDYDTRMIVNSSGNVGIGTNSPGEKLEVSGKILATGGQIRAGSYLEGFPSFSFANDTDTGMFSDTANQLEFSTGGSSRLTIDSSGNVGIGMNSPDATLHIGDNSSSFTLGTTSGDSIDLLKLETSSTNANQLIFSSERVADGSDWTTTRERIRRRVDTSEMGYIQFGSSFDTTNARMISFGEVGVGDYMGITGDGKVGIGTESPGYKLDVAGDAKISSGSLGVGVNPNATDGRGDFSNDVVAYSTSDKRLKENIKPLDSALDKVLKISGVEFDWKELTEEEKKTIHGNEGHDVGVIAQEIEEVLPEVVTTRESGYKAVKYEKIVPLLIEAIKEQQQQINQLEEKLNG